MSLVKQIIAVALLVAGVFGAVMLYQHLMPSKAATVQGPGGPGGPGMRAAVAVETAMPQLHPVMSTLEAVGTTVARQSINVTPLTSGRLASINIRAGQQVEAGAVLFELDRDLEEADLAQARAALKEAELALERAVTLRENRNVAQATVDELTAKRITARASVDRALRRLADREIKAPFAGTVGLIPVDVGARVDDNTLLTTLDDLSQVEVQFSVPEHLFGKVRLADRVIARAEAYPGLEFEGQVSQIDSRVDQASRSFKVRAAIPNEERMLPAGMFMLVALVLDQVQALMIPEESVVAQADRAFVWLAHNDRALRREVSLGRRTPGLVEVTAGITGEDRVIVRGTGQVREGAPIHDATESAADHTGAPGAGPTSAVPTGRS